MCIGAAISACLLGALWVAQALLLTGRLCSVIVALPGILVYYLSPVGQ